ncbi:hypothetical protein C1H46_000673 [Malus baccata]|uniref:Glycosyl transferase family 1 domain-containing protein n=1 Tax=Malus baccata TaxID=106549 RepID=A0A540NRJ8_MALBA|nr:hypothetical protein C1H46_000673 [Malus baccata]
MTSTASLQLWQLAPLSPSEITIQAEQRTMAGKGKLFRSFFFLESSFLCRFMRSLGFLIAGGKRGRACVVVLGDIGRSPRMQYHALSLARQPQWQTFTRGLPNILRPFVLLIKAVTQFVMLLWFLCIKIPAPDVYLVQPPEFFRPASLEEKHKLFCRLDKNLRQPLGVHDCTSTGSGEVNTEINDTLFTTLVGTDVTSKPHRPALIVSSTSWTPDEDFEILLEAAVMYDRRVAAILNEEDSTKEEVLWKDIHSGKQYLYPRLLFVITGKGPEKQKYEEKISRLHLKRVSFRTMWLSAEDYPLLLGSADLGVCLHTSSSGLDLPMKVVDMFGCGLPVCAVSYSCIKELVQVEKNGLLFSSSSELADELLMLFKGFPDACGSLKVLRNGALEMASSGRWATEWEEHAKALILEMAMNLISEVLNLQVISKNSD